MLGRTSQMINNVVLVGRLTATPDLRKTPNGVSSLQGTLAVNRNFKNQNGEREADFINFQSWRGVADVIAQYCSKGALIGITGRLRVRSYEKNGERRYITEVIAETVTLLELTNLIWQMMIFHFRGTTWNGQNGQN